jgi:hypothetical protein
LDQFAYQYFLKPFYSQPYKRLFSERLWRRVKQVPYYRTARLPFVRVSNFTPRYSLAPEGNAELVSPLSRDYLTEMHRLAESKGVAFTLLGAPVRESKRESFRSALAMAEEKGELDGGLLEQFRKSVLYFPDSLFVDENHFLREAVPEDPCQLFVSSE